MRFQEAVRSLSNGPVDRSQPELRSHVNSMLRDLSVFQDSVKSMKRPYAQEVFQRDTLLPQVSAFGDVLESMEASDGSLPDTVWSALHRLEFALQSLPPQYPAPRYLHGNSELRELPALQNALENGLRVNSLMDEAHLVPLRRKNGCVVPAYVSDEEAWPHFNTPLHRAVCFGDLESADYLLQHGADIDLYNSIGRTALHEAVENQVHNAVSFLLAHGADTEKPTIEAHVRCENRDKDLYARTGDMALWMALRAGDCVSLRLLIDGGVNIHPHAQGPWTALDLALLAKDARSVKVLLRDRVELPNDLPSKTSISSDECEGAAQKLLAMVQSDKLIPSEDLYSVYCNAWSHATSKSDHSRHDAFDIDKFIERLFGALRELAGEQPVTRSGKCTTCLEFESSVSEIFATKAEFRHQIHTDRHTLDACARDGCDLCGLAADGLDIAERKRPIPESNASSPVFLSTKPYISPSGMASFISLTVRCGELSNDIDISWAREAISLGTFAHTEDADTGSRAAMHIARDWIKICQDDDGHSACHKAYRNDHTGQGMPARLIYVPETDEQPRLVDASGINVPYCALSYCWGQDPFFTTRQANLTQNMRAIPQALIPVMFRDAIRVTRALGYNHLWIDALCIVQDDVADWNREAARMHIIYSHAALTISPLVAEDCQTSLFRPRTLRTCHPVPLDIWQPKKSTFDSHTMIAIPEWAKSDPGLRGHVHSRAWTLQEQLLSPRLLYFGDGMLHWECLSSYLFEADPEGSQKRMYNYWTELDERRDTRQTIHAISPSKKSAAGPTRPDHLAFESWKQQLETFSSRKITKNSDRLPAFFSISERLAQAAGNKAVCGVWDGSKLLESLCWRVSEPQERAGTVSTTPTWSWAHIEGEISFDVVDRRGRGDVDTRPRATVLSLDIDAHETMSETTGSITIRGTLRQMAPFDKTMLDQDNTWETLMLQAVNLSTPQVVFFDHRPESMDDCFAFDLLSFPTGPGPTGHGYPMWPHGRPPSKAMLLLQAVGDDLRTFRRIGVASVPGDADGFDDAVVDSEDGDMTPLSWLMLNQKVLPDRVITII